MKIPFDIVPKKNLRIISGITKTEFPNGGLTMKQNQEFIASFTKCFESKCDNLKSKVHSMASSWIFPLINSITFPDQKIPPDSAQLKNIRYLFKQSFLSLYLLFKSQNFQIFNLISKKLLYIFIKIQSRAFIIVNDLEGSLIDCLKKRGIGFKYFDKLQNVVKADEQEAGDSMTATEPSDIQNWLSDLGIDENSVSFSEEYLIVLFSPYSL